MYPFTDMANAGRAQVEEFVCHYELKECPFQEHFMAVPIAAGIPSSKIQVEFPAQLEYNNTR